MNLPLQYELGKKFKFKKIRKRIKVETFFKLKKDIKIINSIRIIFLLIYFRKEVKILALVTRVSFGMWPNR